MLPALPHLACLASVVLGAGAVAQQFAEFERQALPPAHDRTAALAAADLDGDGDQDLVVAVEGAYPGRPLTLLLGQGNGRFQDAPAGALPPDALAVRAIVPFDPNRDGLVDLFVACQDFQQNRLWLNVGGGFFVDVTTVTLPVAMDDSRTAVAGDVDGDLDPDLVVMNASGGSRTLLNNGQGIFMSGPSLPVQPGDFVIDTELRDVDNDGDRDLLLANALGVDRLLTNDGAGTFTDVTAVQMPPTAQPSTATAALDVDRDGDTDFVVINHGVADHVLINDGLGTFTRDALALPGSDGHGADVTTGDFDGDGDVDLCVAERLGADSLWLNNGNGTFARRAGAGWPVVEDESTAVLAFDADGDGDVDLVCGGGRSASAPGRRRLLINDGTATYFDATEALWPSGDSETLALATADFDRDGALDVLIGGVGGFVELWFGDGTGRLRIDPNRIAPTLDGRVQAFDVGDLDGDGYLDVVAGVAGQSAVLVNDGTGWLLDETVSRLPADSDDTQDVVLADFDGDGDPDLMFANAGPSPLFAQQNRMFENSGSGFFTDVTTARLPRRFDFTHALAVGDVDRDGDLDVVSGNWHIPLPPNPAQANLLLLNDGFGALTEATGGELPPGFAATAGIALGDVDGDQDLDLVTVHAQGSPDYFYRNDGTGRFTLDTVLPGTSFSASFDVALDDLDLDGDLDIAIGLRSQPNVLLRNDGALGFVDISASDLPGGVEATMAVALADLDGDGDADILFGNRAFQKDRLLVNRLRQLEVPYAARVGLEWPVDVQMSGVTGGPAFAALWISNTRLQVPIHVPPFGDYHLGMVPPLEAGVRSVDPILERARFPFVLPSVSALVGSDIHLQALAIPSTSPADMRLTGRWHDIFRD